MYSRKPTALLIVMATTWLTAAVLPARADNKTDISRWEKDIAAFEARDKDHPPSPNGVLFAGSSSIRLWKLEKSFPELGAINRGFGGSHIADSVHFAPRIIIKVKPSIVVLYAGDNDIAAGKTPERVLADFQAFVKVVHADLPKTKILFIAIKPSIKRWALADTIRKANGLIESYCKQDERLTYVDVVKPMLGTDGKPRPELFVKDGLHMNDEGYKLWTSILKPLLK